METQCVDQLAAINDALRSKGSSGSGPWLALESNPEIFSDFARRIGFPIHWQFCDVFGLDAGLLDLVPRPVAACVLLFPCSDRIYAARRAQDAALRAGAECEGASAAHDAELFFLKQVVGFGNACGTVACLHATSNSRIWAGLAKDAPLDRFVRTQETASPEERGQALLSDVSLRASSESAATSDAAQTACPDRHGPALDHHFTAFVRSRRDRLVELDGTKRGPVDLGSTSEATFLEDVAAAVKRHFMDVEPDSLDFSLLALVKGDGQPCA